MPFSGIDKVIKGRFGDVMNAVPDALVIVDPYGKIVLANEHAANMFGYALKDLDVLHVDQLLPQRFRDSHASHRLHYEKNAVARPMGSVHAELWGLRSDGSEFPVEISLSPISTEGKTLVVAAIRDMSVRRRAEDKLREVSVELDRSRAGLKAVLDSLEEGVIVFTLDGQVVDANPAALKMHGYEDVDDARKKLHEFAPEFHIFTTSGEVVPVDDWPLARIARGEVVSDVELEVWTLSTANRGIYSYSGTAVKDASGNQILCVCTVRDITLQKEAEERVRQAGLHDALTGLPNRALLVDYSRHVFARARRSGGNTAVLFIDLDRFKPINDTYGHDAGDAMLKAVASRITSSIRQEDIAFRLGGDEFLVILPNIDEASRAGEVARNLGQRIAEPLSFDGIALSVGTSIGISVYPRDSDDIDTLINQADLAMYHAKHMGRGRFHFYSQALAERASVQGVIEEQLRAALDLGQFTLYYQPLIDLHTGQLTSVEALLRWPNESSPDHFVPVAETTGLIGKLGEWVIAEACRQHNLWVRHGLPAIPIAVNVSAVQFKQFNLAQLFGTAVRQCSVGADALQLELTETALMDDMDRAIEQLIEMKSLGIKVALDDFGTGYSSLRYLSRLPIDKIKVDKSFVCDIERDPVSRSITDAIIALGRSLNLEVVAEGIESLSVLQYLRMHGCTQAQGFHVCEPVAAEAFETWFRKRESPVPVQ